MSDPRCICTMGQSLTGDGCRYCQPQEHIDRLGEWLDEEREDNERLIEALRNTLRALDGEGGTYSINRDRKLLAKLESAEGKCHE